VSAPDLPCPPCNERPTTAESPKLLQLLNSRLLFLSHAPESSHQRKAIAAGASGHPDHPRPTFVFPTATSKFAGQGAWEAAPAFAAVYTGVPRLLIGFLLQNPISFAYTSSNRPAQNTFALQPAVLFTLWDGWYLRSADATWVYGWRSHSPSLLPLSLGVGRVMVRPGLPPLNFFFRHNGLSAGRYSKNRGATRVSWSCRPKCQSALNSKSIANVCQNASRMGRV
jgi:hypothetical protein